MARRIRGVALAATVCVLASTVSALADNADVTATALFDEGRKLMGDNRYAEACPKLAESQTLAPSGGTLMNLADCYEHTGQTASAWSAWKQVAARANAAGKAAAERSALARAAALESTLARLTIAVAPGSDVPGLDVTRDGMLVGRAEFGLALPVDPGPHRVDAGAPGRKASRTDVDVAAKRTDARVTIDLIAQAAPPTATGTIVSAPPPAPAAEGASRKIPPPAAPPSSVPTGSAQKTLAWVGLGVGAAGVAFGAIFGTIAISKAGEATGDGCSGKTCPDQYGVNATNTAQNAATLADIGLIAGGAVAAASVVLLFTAPDGRSVHLEPSVGQSSIGCALGGDW